MATGKPVSFDEMTRVFCGEPFGLAGNPTQGCLYKDKEGRLFDVILFVPRGSDGSGLGVEAVSTEEALQMIAEHGELHSLELLSTQEAQDWLEAHEASFEAYAIANVPHRQR